MLADSPTIKVVDTPRHSKNIPSVVEPTLWSLINTGTLSDVPSDFFMRNPDTSTTISVVNLLIIISHEVNPSSPSWTSLIVLK